MPCSTPASAPPDIMKRLLALLLLITTQRALGQAFSMPPVESGLVNGKTSLLYWPIGPNSRLLDPTGCTVHLVPLTDHDQELVFDCGTWIQPPTGKYVAWIQTEESMTAHPIITNYVPSNPVSGSIRSALLLQPAGEVVLARPHPDQSFRLLHLPSPSEAREHRAIDRRSPADSRHSVLMPEGDVLAALFDKKTNNARAVARPVHVKHNSVVSVDPQPPTVGTDILLILERQQRRERGPIGDAAVALRLGNRELSPDVLSDTATRLVAVWYGVEATDAELVFRSQREFFPAQPLRLRAKDVSTIRGEITRLPSVEATIEGVSNLTDAALTVKNLRTSATVLSLPARAGTSHLESLPAEAVEIALHVGGEVQLHRTVDLSNGLDQQVTFTLEPLQVTGTLFRGDTPSAGHLLFSFGQRDAASAEAGQDGQFAVTLWTPGTYFVEVTTPHSTSYRQPFVVIDEAHRNLKIRVPDNEIRVHVGDKDTGRAIAGAKVSSVNSTLMGESMVEVTTRTTDESGDTLLPPMKPGHVSIAATADGYLPSEKQQVEVAEDSPARDVEIAMRPRTGGVRVKINGPDGAPAIGADVRLIASPNDGVPQWSSTYTDPDGVMVPLTTDGFLLARMRGAASAIVPMSKDQDVRDVRLTQEGEPLVVSVRARDGAPVRSARLALWFDSYRVTLQALGFLTWSTGSVSPEGILIARGLPRSSTRAIAWQGGPDQIWTGAFDTIATAIPYPWHSVIPLTLVK